MKRIFLIVGLLGVLMFSITGCLALNEPELNEDLRTTRDTSYELNNLVYIPASKDWSDLVSLFQKVDEWITNHPEVEIISVETVNASRRLQVMSTREVISGVLIAFRPIKR